MYIKESRGDASRRDLLKGIVTASAGVGLAAAAGATDVKTAEPAGAGRLTADRFTTKDGTTLYYSFERPLMDGTPEFEIRAATPENAPFRVLARIPASRVPKFRAGKALKEACNS